MVMFNGHLRDLHVEGWAILIPLFGLGKWKCTDIFVFSWSVFISISGLRVYSAEQLSQSMYLKGRHNTLSPLLVFLFSTCHFKSLIFKVQIHTLIKVTPRHEANLHLNSSIASELYMCAF